MKWWDWSDPAFTFAFITIVIAFLSFLATVAIPIGLWKLGKKGSEDTQKFLSNLEELVRSQRLSYIIDRLKKSRDSQEVTQLDKEVEDWPKEAGKEVLVRLYWSNPVAPLPKDLSGLSKGHVDCIMDSLLERCRIRGNCSEHELEFFIKKLQQENLDVPYGRFAEVYTDPKSAFNVDKSIGHNFYRDLVREIPEMSNHLIEYVGSQVLEDPRYGGFKFNILVGVLVGSLEVIEGNTINDVISYKNKLIHSLAAQMYPLGYRVFSGIGDWDLRGYSDTPTMLAAWLVDTIGFLSDKENIFDRSDQHCLGRTIETLPDTLKGIYKQAYKEFSPDLYLIKWGKDDRHVRRGVETIKKNQTDLWQKYGEAIEKELDKVGSSWRNADLSSLAWDL